MIVKRILNGLSFKHRTINFQVWIRENKYRIYPKYSDRQAKCIICLQHIHHFLDTLTGSIMDLFKFLDKYGGELRQPNIKGK